ncbi:MAG: hypothetical protein SFV21_02655 [Rhodospirillaceae bacterium]|nr:hypothetical protein [Rhodospirillaceae bacterium]
MRTRHRGLVAGLLILNFCCGAMAQTPAARYAPEFEPLAYLAGSCWQGPLSEFVRNRSGSGAGELLHCAEWILNGHALRDTLWVEGANPPVRGETTYYFDLETQTLRYIFWSVDGPHSVGTVKVDGDTLIFDDERLVGRRGIIHFRTTFTRTGPDTYVQDRQRQGSDGVWTNLPPTTYIRRPGK